jgi:hypothetical protein
VLFTGGVRAVPVLYRDAPFSAWCPRGDLVVTAERGDPCRDTLGRGSGFYAAGMRRTPAEWERRPRAA